MGIKFLCPNGHKLHVKSYLSGKKAICPKCGVRVVVPAEDGAAALADLAPIPADDSLFDATETQPLSAIDLAAAVANESAPAGSSAQPVSNSPSVENPRPTPQPTIDPIAESPSAVWCVRPATGGQYGPASGEIMRGWMQDGRVGASSLVWRAGWSEWRSAAEIFPQLGAMLAAPGPVAVGVPLPSAQNPLDLPAGAIADVPTNLAAAAATSDTVSSMTKLAIKRRQRSDADFKATAALIVLTVILVIGLMLVFRANSTSTEAEPSTVPAKDGASDAARVI